MPDMPEQNWVYQARLVRVIDGDTVVLEVDLGHTVHSVPSLRLEGVNSPEMHAHDSAPGLAARKFTADWMAAATRSSKATAWPLVIMSKKDEKYGRYLATIWRRKDGHQLNADLLSSGHAVEMKG